MSLVVSPDNLKNDFYRPFPDVRSEKWDPENYEIERRLITVHGLTKPCQSSFFTILWVPLYPPGIRLEAWCALFWRTSWSWGTLWNRCLIILYLGTRLEAWCALFWRTSWSWGTPWTRCLTRWWRVSWVLGLVKRLISWKLIKIIFLDSLVAGIPPPPSLKGL